MVSFVKSLAVVTDSPLLRDIYILISYILIAKVTFKRMIEKSAYYEKIPNSTLRFSDRGTSVNCTAANVRISPVYLKFQRKLKMFCFNALCILQRSNMMRYSFICTRPMQR